MRRVVLLTGVTILGFAAAGCGGGGSSNSSNKPYVDDGYPAQIDVAEATLTGQVFYVDPASGAIGNNGSASSPWNTLQAVIAGNRIETRQPASYPYAPGVTFVTKNPGAPVKAGDTIVLKSGHHGEVVIDRYFNAEYINVIAEPGATVSLLHLRAASKWRFKGLTIRPNDGYPSQYALLRLETHNWSGPVFNITIDDGTIYSVENSSTAWSTTDPSNWDTRACSGIMAMGDNITIRRNLLKNVNFGITVYGNYSLVSHNTVENFSGDGMRGVGNDLFFEDNLVKNCYAVNANHDDGFQSWSDDNLPCERVVLRGNTFINSTDPNQPFRGSLQGIGCFDGWYVDWVVENNVVITDNWHGISFYGARNCRIVNNTVIDQNDVTPGPPRITFHEHKDGTPSSNCLIRNNISPAYHVSQGVTADHNYTIPDFAAYSTLFVDHENFNTRLRKGAVPIDAGTAELAPRMDFDGRARPFGDGIDIGAFEYYP